MPVQYPNARIPFGDVMQAIEDKLLLDGVVTDRSQVAWGTPKNVPQFSGPFDVLLIARNGMHTPYDGAAGQLPMQRYVDVFYRSQVVANPGGGFKTWVKSVFVAADKAIDSVANDNFWPIDSLGNLLTVESIKLVGDVPPDYVDVASVFGDYICTIDCKYFPAVDPTKGP